MAYELIPFSQRRRLHAAAAEAQEGARTASSAGAIAAAPPAANIAYHWQHACETVEVTEWRRALKVESPWNQCHQLLWCLSYKFLLAQQIRMLLELAMISLDGQMSRDQFMICHMPRSYPG